ncbi:MAG: FecR domain-containing protein [Rikenellaceae bacterium]|nr:FecR domain-containing protein [Rikenellaceae bacterium]
MTKFDITEELLVAYLRGELDDSANKAVEKWYDVGEANRKKLGDLYYILFVSDRIHDAASINVERSLRELKGRMRAGRRKRIRRTLFRFSAAAAVVILLISASMVTVSVSGRLEAPTVVTTQVGERSQVVLPDGTKVWLNSASSIEYSRPFPGRQKRIKMEGEAYFEARHDKKTPLVVSTGGLNIKVVGTKFNIRNDDNDHRVTTVLLEGAVAATTDRSDRSAVMMRPGHKLVYDMVTGAMQLVDDPMVSQSINWIDGRFAFENETFENIISEFKRYFNVDVRIMDEGIKKERFSGQFQAEDGIYYIMSVLQLTHKFTYKVVGNDIEIYATTIR